MILATARGDREYRAAEWGSSAIPPITQMGGYTSSSGIRVDNASAVGLPAVSAAVRLVSETVASLPFEVFSGQDAYKRKVVDVWQSALLGESPNPDCSAFDFLADLAACVETCGNAYVRKLKARGKVLALYLLDPTKVVVKRTEGNAKVFEIWYAGQVQERLDAGSVLHVRGFTHAGGDMGLSPIQVHREALGSALALQQFQGRFFRNDATTPTYMSVPGSLTRTQAKEMVDSWNSSHAGLENKYKFGILYNGAEMKQLGMPLADAQFIESQRFSSEDVARMFRISPASLLDLAGGPRTPPPTEQDSLRFLNFSLLPRLRRIEHAFKADLDLFSGTDLYPQFHTDEFLRADAATLASVMHQKIQSGVWLVDEARAREGLAPLPDGQGQIPQITPVGGAPNPALNPSPNTQE